MAKLQNGFSKNMWIGIWKGIAASVIAVVVALVIAATLLSGEYLGMESSGYLCGATTFIAAFIGAAVAVSGAGERKMLAGILSAFVFLVILAVLGLLLFGGPLRGVGITSLLIGGAGVAACLVGMRHKTTKKYGYARKRF